MLYLLGSSFIKLAQLSASRPGYGKQFSLVKKLSWARAVQAKVSSSVAVQVKVAVQAKVSSSVAVQFSQLVS